MAFLHSTVRNMSVFKNRIPPPCDPVFSITENFKKDTSLLKINLGVGAYQNDEGKPWVLPIVRKAEMEIAADNNLNKEYLPISGDGNFINSCVKLIFGDNHDVVKNKKVDGIQTLSGTGACRIGLEYLRSYQDFQHVYLSDPTWAIHQTISKFAGFQSFKKYSYFDYSNNFLNFNQMKQDLKNAEPGSIIILHGSGHNPTGVDPTNDQWDELSEIFKTSGLFPFFDCAYMGFCSGDVNIDAYPVRKFASDGHEMFVGVSFAKIMGLYNERVGCLAFINHDGALSVIKDQMKILVRNNYSNPPSHGARIVNKILSNPQYMSQWGIELNIMTSRIMSMRQKLYDHLVSMNTPGDWKHILKQRGLFSFTGLNKEQVEKLAEKHHIYLTKNGRINICGLTPTNVEYVAKAINDVVTV